MIIKIIHDRNVIWTLRRIKDLNSAILVRDYNIRGAPDRFQQRITVTIAVIRTSNYCNDKRITSFASNGVNSAWIRYVILRRALWYVFEILNAEKFHTQVERSSRRHNITISRVGDPIHDV